MPPMTDEFQPYKPSEQRCLFLTDDELSRLGDWLVLVGKPPSWDEERFRSMLAGHARAITFPELAALCDWHYLSMKVIRGNVVLKHLHEAPDFENATSLLKDENQQ